MKNSNPMPTALMGFGISIVNASFTCCICGYLDFISLPGSFVGLVIACYALFMGKNLGITRRIVIYLACIATTLILLKNVLDILWFGHNPLLG